MDPNETFRSVVTGISVAGLAGLWMLETCFARLRSALSIALGTPFHIGSLERLVEGARNTRPPSDAASWDRTQPRTPRALESTTRREMERRRFCPQAARAAPET